MSETFPILLFAVLYSVLLFGVAWHADRNKESSKLWLQRWRPLIYSLALAVYCSSWTFFGAVGQATGKLWSYLPIYLGPMLVFLLGHRFLQKLARVGERQKVTSIADFIGSRYGKSQSLSALVTICALAGSLPYIALQLRAVTMAWETISGSSAGVDTAFVAAVLLCLFAILFGTRNLEGRERNRGMVTAIALESLIKLMAFAAIAFIAMELLSNAPAAEMTATEREWMAPLLNANFFTQTLLASVAIVCLPRQFHMAVVEYRHANDLRTARWLLPLYLLLFSLLVLPIAIAGHDLLGVASYSPDSLALLLPNFAGRPAFVTVAFIGGLSAATGMVIVASITLSVMISNELVAPLWLRLSRDATTSVAFFGNYLKLIRRVSIALILLLAWQVNRALVGFGNLADLGLLAFAAAAQFAPALLCGLYWKRAHRNGVLAGLLAGYGLWFYCLILPALFPALPLVTQGPWNLLWLRPQQLFGFAMGDALTHGVFWSLLSNTLLVVGISVASKQRELDAQQATAWVDADNRAGAAERDEPAGASTISGKQLRTLLASFLSGGQLETLWRSYEQRCNQRLLADDLVPTLIVNDAERTLAGVVGAATAQHVMALLQQGRPLQFEDIANLVDHASRELRFSQSVLQTTVETVSQGISVIDAELRLVAWNSRYQQLFGYPAELLYIGCPIESLYRVNAERGLYGDNPADIEAGIQQRLQLLREGKPHQFERRLLDGTILEVRGNAMPGGGFVTTYTDITGYRQVVAALEETKATLEERVQQRTGDLSTANAALQVENARRAEAEDKLHELHAAKSRFLAYTSHDLMQPLNAARLFTGALQQEQPALAADFDNINKALDNASELVEALREISRLDSGSLRPQLEHFPIDELLTPLVAEFQLSASRKNLKLLHVKSSALVCSDRHLLRRILQNLLSNAVHYTRQGRVVVGCRRRQHAVEIQVWDTGPGIAADDVDTIFEEFVRLERSGETGGKGLGLGLAIARRSAQLLGHAIRVDSRAGSGSMFALTVQRGSAQHQLAPRSVPAAPEALVSLAGLRVLCIDNDPAIRAGMRKLLQSWACDVVAVAGHDAAVAALAEQPQCDILLLDYHLDRNQNGIDCFNALRQRWAVAPYTLLISADTSEPIRAQARLHGMQFLAKPVKPAALLNLLRVAVRQRLSQVEV